MYFEYNHNEEDEYTYIRQAEVDISLGKYLKLLLVKF